MDPWIEQAAAEIARRAPRELEALVAVSSPSGDVHGAEECASVCAVMLPDEAVIERVPCSSPGHAEDLVARLHGTGARRVLLLGHVDTVVQHAHHKPLHRDGEQLVGSGTIDMKGGDILAIAAMRAFAQRPDTYAELALLLVCDEEWRTAPFSHVERFAGFDACLCFEAGELVGEAEGVIVRRKAAGTIHVDAHGRSAHSGSAPDRGRNALLALAAAAQAVASRHDPHGPARLTAVPTVLRSGDAFNVVPGRGELFCDLRADDLEAIEAVLQAIPARGRRRAAGQRAGPPLAGDALRGGHRPAAGAGDRAARPRRRPRRPRRRQRREPLRRLDPAHRRRPRPARRQGAQPGGVRARGLAAPARRGRAGGDRRSPAPVVPTA